MKCFLWFVILLLGAGMMACGGGNSGESGSNSSGPLPDVVGDCGVAENGAGTGRVDYVMVYKSTLSEWCVDSTFWAVSFHRQAITSFFPYGDAVVEELEALFQLTPQGLPFVFEVTTPTGGAHTGADFGSGLGDTVTGDAFYNSFNDPVTGAPIQGFWGYLLTLHEAVNVFTGIISPGWPADWWADHRSPFPNSVDYHILQDLGTKLENSTLQAAAVAQHERFGVSTLSGYDTEVAMFDDLYAQFGGFTGFRSAFKLIQGDKLVWTVVTPGNPPDDNAGPLLTGYVIAYLQLGFKTATDLTQTVFVADGVGTLDTQTPPYTVDSNAVLGVANAHCSIRSASAAGVDTSAALTALQQGHYQDALVSGGTQATCPSECLWETEAGQCAAPWAPPWLGPHGVWQLH
jgi:hypothetical protein